MKAPEATSAATATAPATKTATTAAKPSSISGTGVQPYTSARIEYLATYLQTLLPGLTHAAAVKWITSEQGVHGNVLGLRKANGDFYTYSSQEAGLRAAASWIKSAPAWTGYPDIVKSLSTGDTNTQLRAIAASAWNGSHYSGWHLTGTTSVKTTATGSKKPTSTVNTSVSIDPGIVQASSPQTLDPQLVAKLKALGIPTTLSHVISQTEAALIAKQLYGQDPTSGLGLATVNKLTGMTIGDWAGGAAGEAIPGSGAVGGVVNAITGLGGFFQFFSANIPELLAVAVGVPIALIGFYLLAGVQQQTA